MMGILFIDCIFIVECGCDEVGDWCVILYFLYGMKVYVLWVLVINVCVRECFGVEGFVVVSDDGIIVCIFDVEVEFLGVELFVFDLDEFEVFVM